MACSDCEDCSKHIDNGGKCIQFEYNCPFSHLDAFNDSEKIRVTEDIETATELKKEINELLNKYENKFNDIYNYEDVILKIKSAHFDLEEMLDENLIKEWHEINNTSN